MDVYAVKWDEERVIKWLAVGMCLAMAGLVMFGVNVGDASYLLYKSGFVNAAGWEAAQAVANSWGLIGAGVAIFNPAVGGSILVGAGIGLF